jgi:hypothetical protein
MRWWMYHVFLNASHSQALIAILSGFTFEMCIWRERIVRHIRSHPTQTVDLQMPRGLAQTARSLVHASQTIGALTGIPDKKRQVYVLMSALEFPEDNMLKFMCPPELRGHVLWAASPWESTSVVFLLSMVLFYFFTSRAPWAHLPDDETGAIWTRVLRRANTGDVFQSVFSRSWLCASSWFFFETHRKCIGATDHPRPWFEEQDDCHIPVSVVCMLQRCWDTEPLRRPTLAEIGDEIRMQLFKVLRTCAVAVCASDFVSLSVLAKWCHRCFVVAHVEFQTGTECRCSGCKRCAQSLLAWNLCRALAGVQFNITTAPDAQIVEAWRGCDALFDLYSAALPYLTDAWLPVFLALDARLKDLETRVSVCKARESISSTQLASPREVQPSFSADLKIDDFVPGLSP